MKVENNKLNGVAYKATPNVSGKINPIYIVMHYDAASNATSAINWMTNPKSQVSAHLHISRDAVVTQLAPFNVKCWHAGVSSWKGLSGLNSYSIGIELQNDGKQEYTAKQLEVAKIVCMALICAYPIKEILGHDEIAPSRKIDPGKHFPMAEFKELVK
ncbi:N-acetylmuramoyl-L-alanine amidase [Sphingobacterium hungaricum]|uniref:N-acetylmuramoyl-L-alanine amidase n=1 Tax=Sphingobacterium hungaricum TaxID=2082723 RepID=A0A928USR5_9SPHI|nr:N-acetylmuramoyl-L-alanine amidase [Sphingobacterium hungaricum]MBE8712525.1 hypothetical protein [Sphingobacterium hungaricum]